MRGSNALWAGLFAVALGAPAHSQAAAPSVTAPEASGQIRIDGLLDESAWREAGTITDLIQQDPEPGAQTPYRTEILLLREPANLLIGLRCHDPAPERIRVRGLRRDVTQDNDDHVSFVLDTFGDGRNGYVFSVNADGARTDGLLYNGAEEASLDWDGLWEARTQRTPDGWTAEIRIDARTLGFNNQHDAWGFNVERYVASERLTLRWTGLTRDARLVDLQRAGRLLGMSGLEQGRGLELVPYAVASAERGFGVQESDSDAGFDLRYHVTPELLGVLTVNTDFAETEVDDAQVNLTRFPLLFPEKRAFFLEGSNLFEYSLGLSSTFIPFYSRRVGLVDGLPVPIDAGAKIVGRQGPWSIALLDTRTGERDALPGTNLFAGRAAYDVTPELRIGTLVTDGDPSGESDNRFAGVDAVWRTSAFHGDRNFSVSGWTARSYGDIAPGQASGYGGKIAYPNDRWDVFAEYNVFGDSLNPALGFLSRPGTRQLYAGGAYQPRPSSPPFNRWVRQFAFELFYDEVDGLDGVKQSTELFAAPFNIETPAGGHYEANWIPIFERLDEPFEISAGVIIPAGDYDFTRYRIETESPVLGPWQFGQATRFGSFYDGHLVQFSPYLNWSSDAGRWQLHFSGDWIDGHLPQGDFVEHLWQVRLTWSRTADFVVDSLVQGDSSTNALGANTRLRWTFRPGRDLFVVWNSNFREPLSVDPSSDIAEPRNALVVKLRWTFGW